MAGQYRTVEVDAFPSGDLPPHWTQVPAEMWAFDNELTAKTAGEPPDAAAAVDLAVWAHMEVVRIHPFWDGNGRTARLLMNVIIMRHVTRPSQPLNITVDEKSRYRRCVREARQGRPEAFGDLLADMLERLVLEEEQRGGGIIQPWRRIKWPGRAT
jgi:Fic family protein